MVGQTLDDVILQIHSAPLGGADWHTISRAVSDLLKADHFLGLRVTLRPDDAPWFLSSGLDASQLHEYAADWAAFDEWYLGARRHSRVRSGLVSVDDQLVERRTFIASAFANDFLRRCDFDRMINVCLADPSSGLPPAALSFFRGRGKDAFSSRQVEVLEKLSSHLALAARNTWEAGSLKIVTSLQRQALDSISIAVFAIAGADRLLFANSAAEELIRAHRWVRVVNGTLSPARDLHEAKRFGNALDQLQLGFGTTILLTTLEGAQQAVMTTAPISAGSEPWNDSLHAAGLVWIVTSPAEKAPVWQFARLFELTGAEKQLLQLLVDGQDLREAAERLRVSIHTVRNQLKSIFRKTGRRTQAQVLTLVSRIGTLKPED